MKQLVLILIILTSIPTLAQKEVPYTLEDRDRMIRLEAEQKALRKEMNSLRNEMNSEMNSLRNEMNSLRSEMNTRFEAIETKFDAKFESQQKQLNDLKELFYWGFGILIALFIFMLGFMIWDRRTALKPALDKANSAEEKNKSLINALREYARKNPDLAEILKSHGLL
ncbi:MAG: hypothetical protein K9I47_04790 [Bacteroidales bacterium]|nr:hypothetical protein [Bacteroidales bacterium]